MSGKSFTPGTLVKSIFFSSDVPIWIEWTQHEKAASGRLYRNEIALVISYPFPYGDNPEHRGSWTLGYAVEIISSNLVKGWVNINLIDAL